MTIKNKSIIILIISIIVAIIVIALILLNPGSGTLRIITDYPDAQYKINNKLITNKFELVNDRYELMVPIRRGEVGILILGPDNEILFEKGVRIKTNEVTTINVDLETAKPQIRDYLLEGE